MKKNITVPMRKVFYLIATVFVLNVAPAMAQDEEYYKEETPKPAPTESKATEQPLYQPQFNAPQNRINYRLNAGTMFGSGFGGKGFSTYVAPEMSYWVSNRFRLSTGIMLMNSQFSYPSLGEAGTMRGQRNSAIIYASGSYLVNDRLMVSGSAFTDMNGSNNRNNFQVNPYFASPTRGMSVNAEYKVTKNFSIGAGFSTSNGSYYSSPFAPGMNRYGTGFW
jgi:hypothetical protein